MAKPRIAARKPVAVKLEAGKTIYWCACGRSKNQPFCDGSHKGTGFTPLAYTPEVSGEAWLCQCKQTNTPPLCDGTHANLPEEGDAGEPDKSGNTQHAKAENRIEPTLARIQDLALNGLQQSGSHGEIVAMGVPRAELPHWDSIQILAAQLARRPLEDDVPVSTELVIGPNAGKPLRLSMPLFVSDMSFGSLSREAKLALAGGAELAGTGICSGEGGMLPAEQQANSRYFYELASARFGYREDLLPLVQAFHFKAGQAAKTGVGGHLPGIKVTQEIADVRGLKAGQPAISPATFAELRTTADFRDFAAGVREITGGIPIGFKMSANHIEDDIDFALEASADYIILDGRGGASGATPAILRDNISVPTIPALARARKHLDACQRDDVTLIITGGLRVPEDFVKALALGADGVALANSALHAIGCVAARICNTNRCPSGVATQDPQLRQQLDVEQSAQRLQRFLQSSVSLMQLMARACGHERLDQFTIDDLTTCSQEMSRLSGIRYAGVRQ